VTSLEAATPDSAPGLFRALGANGGLLAQHEAELAELVSGLTNFRISGLKADHPVIQPFADLLCTMAGSNTDLVPAMFRSLCDQMLPHDDEDASGHGETRGEEAAAAPSSAPSSHSSTEALLVGDGLLESAAAPSQSVVTVIHALLRTAPTSLPLLYKAIAAHHPHPFSPRVRHEVYNASLLLLSRRLPAVEDRVLASILAKVVGVDSLVRAGVEASDAARAIALDMSQDEATRGEADAEVKAQLERVRPLADSLDTLLGLLFLHCDRQLGCEAVGWMPRLGVDDDGASEAPQGAVEDTEAGHVNSASHLTDLKRGPEWPALRHRRRQHMLALLLASLEQTMLPSRPRFAHFLILYVARLGPDLADAFVGHLVNSIRDKQVDVSHRACYAAYAGGFLARAKFLHHTTLRSALFFLVGWARQHLRDTAAESADMKHLSASQRRERRTFYAVVQACFYVTCFRSRLLLSTPNGRAFLASLGWEELVVSSANPLKQCVKSVATEFGRVATLLRLVPRHSEAWKLLRETVQPEPVKGETPASKAAPAAILTPGGKLASRNAQQARQQTVRVTAFALAAKSAGVSSSGQGARAGTPSTSVRLRHELSNGESEESELRELRQTLSYFPFDPYLLSRSLSFIKPLFCEWEDVCLGPGVTWADVCRAEELADDDRSGEAWKLLSKVSDETDASDVESEDGSDGEESAAPSEGGESRKLSEFSASRQSTASQSQELSKVMARALAGARGMGRQIRGLSVAESDYRDAVKARREQMGGLEEGLGALGLNSTRTQEAMVGEVGGVGRVDVVGGGVISLADPRDLYGGDDAMDESIDSDVAESDDHGIEDDDGDASVGVSSQARAAALRQDDHDADDVGDHSRLNTIHELSDLEDSEEDDDSDADDVGREADSRAKLAVRRREGRVRTMSLSLMHAAMSGHTDAAVLMQSVRVVEEDEAEEPGAKRVKQLDGGVVALVRNGGGRPEDQQPKKKKKKKDKKRRKRQRGEA
jgi:hypothetical protein